LRIALKVEEWLPEEAKQRRRQHRPRFREWNGKGSLVAFVVSLNLHRRHLSSSQKGPIALEVEEWLAKEAKQRQKEHGKTAPGRKTLTQKVEQVSRDDRLATAQAAAIVGSRPTGANPRPGNAERSQLVMQSGWKVNKPSSCLTGPVRRGDLARPSLRISVGGPTSPVPSATRKVGWR
jgi:hypothetical protein